MAWFQGLSKDLTEGLAEFGADLGQIGKVRDARQLEKLLFDDEDATRLEVDSAHGLQKQQQLQQQRQQQQQEQQQQQQQQQQRGSSNPGPVAPSSAAMPQARPRPLPFGKELRGNVQLGSRADAETNRFSSARTSGGSAGHDGTDPNGASNTILPIEAAGRMTPPRPTPRSTRLTPRNSPTVQPSTASKPVPPTSSPASRVPAVHSSTSQPMHNALTPVAPAPAAVSQQPPQVNLAQGPSLSSQPTRPFRLEHQQQPQQQQQQQQQQQRQPQQQPVQHQQLQQQQLIRPQGTGQRNTPPPSPLTPSARPAQHTNSTPAMSSPAPASSYSFPAAQSHVAHVPPSATTSTSNASSARTGSAAPRKSPDSTLAQQVGQESRQEQKEGVRERGEGGSVGKDGARGGSENWTHPRSQEEMRHAYLEMKDAYGEMKQLLMKSMSECMRLSEDVGKLEGQVQSAEASLAEKAAAEQASRKEVANLKRALDRERAQAAAAQAQAQQQSRPAEADAAQLEALGQELAAAVRKIAAAVEAQEAAEERAAAAEAGRAQADAARKEADKLRWEAQAEAHAAVAAAEAERSTRAEAEGATETLRQEQERRARVFHNAVRAAVGRVQSQLERERDELQSQLMEVQRVLEEVRADLRSSQFAAEEAHIEASQRTADAQAAGHVAAAAEAAARRAAAREAEATSAAHTAEERRAALAQQVAHLQQQLDAVRAEQAETAASCAELTHELSFCRAEHAAQAEKSEREVQVYRERCEISARALQATERQVESAQLAVRDAESRAAAEVAMVNTRVQELEGEVQQLRASSGVMSMFAMPSKEDVLSGLGLKDGQLSQLIQGTGGSDLESNPISRGGPQGKGRATAARVLGIVPLRIVLVCIYLLVLHIAVMVSFTRSNDLGRLCTDAGSKEALNGTHVLQHDKALP